MLSCLWASEARYRLIICTVLSCCSVLWLRSSWPGLLITVLSIPPALAASNTFSIVIGHLPCQTGALAISGGMTCVWKSRIIPVSSLTGLRGCVESFKPGLSLHLQIHRHHGGVLGGA